MSERWFPIATRFGAEQLAVDSLVELGHWAYVPILRETVGNGRGKRAIRESALFPGYAFCWLDRERVDWHAVGAAKGVCGLVRVGNAIVAVPDADIVRAERFVTEARRAKPKAELLYGVGQQVRVVRGAFESFNGIVQKALILKGRPRVVVELSLFGRLSPAELDQADVVRVA